MIKILIVEDDLSLQRLYEMMLTTFGFEVVGKASNGKDAVELFLSMSLKPDIILMDHRMKFLKSTHIPRLSLPVRIDPLQKRHYL